MGRMLLLLMFLVASVAEPLAADAPSAGASGGDLSPGDEDIRQQPGGGPNRWLDEVRAQRRALAQQRRAQMEARRRALDPLGTAQQEAREEAFLRRRNEIRGMLEHDRQLFLNQAPWFRPLPPLPGAKPRPDDDGEHLAPQDWDNGWYYRGW